LLDVASGEIRSCEGRFYAPRRGKPAPNSDTDLHYSATEIATHRDTVCVQTRQPESHRCKGGQRKLKEND